MKEADLGVGRGGEMVIEEEPADGLGFEVQERHRGEAMVVLILSYL